MSGASESTQYGVYRAACAAYIFREIWVPQCSATYEDMDMNARAICLKVLHRVQILNLVLKPKKASTPLQMVNRAAEYY